MTNQLTTNEQGVFTKTVNDTVIRVMVWEDAMFARWQAAVTIFDRREQKLIEDRVDTITTEQRRYMLDLLVDKADTAAHVSGIEKGLHGMALEAHKQQLSQVHIVMSDPLYKSKIARMYWTLIA